MPKLSQYVLIWSDADQRYELHCQGQLRQWFRPGDDVVFSDWLAEQTAFAFVGQAGRLLVLKEARTRGTGYWYAYSTQVRHTRKRYLGHAARVTFTRLEEEAKVLASAPSPDPLASSSPLHKTVASSALQEKTSRDGSGPDMLSQQRQRERLLSSKLSPPRLPLSLVERSRLLIDMEMVRSHPLTLVSAFAGSGKTTLLSAWVAASEQPQANKERTQGIRPAFAWLSLEALDNDPIRFWASVMAALRVCLPGIGETALAMLHTQQSPPLSTILVSLLNDLVEERRDIILILDDYHMISEPTIRASMLFLMDHLPDTLHLVLATRTDPDLPLARLRVRGQLFEIRSRELCFTQEEAASFLRERMGLPLSAEDVATLQHRTEGWVAGLQLAALSLRKQPDLSAFVKDFAGGHRYLLDYVQEEIFAHLPMALQDFLLQTSILSRMHAALCQAVTATDEQQRSQQMLEGLERANLFIVPLDEQRQWYRFHDLMREALRTRLQADHPEQVPVLHLRAARWHEAMGDLREAIAHALAAPDYPYAASLMEQAAPHFWLGGEVRTVQKWVLALPDTVLGAHTRLALDAELRLINSINLSNETLYIGLQAQMERTLTRLEGILHGMPALFLSDGKVALIGRRLRLLRALIEARAILKRGETARLHLLFQEIETLPQDEEVNWSIIPLTLTFWLSLYLQGEGAALIPRLLEAMQKMMEAGDHLVTIRVRTMLAHVYTRAAQWHQARQACLEVLALIEQMGMYTIWSGYVYYNLLITSYAQNRLEEAQDWLQHLQRSARDWQQVELLVRGEICAARLALVRGDLSTAHQALHQLEALVEQEGYAYHAPWVISLQVQCWLAQGNLAEASAWAMQTAFYSDFWDPLRKGEFLMLVRVLLAQLHYTRALELLEQFSEHLDRPGDIDTAIEWMALHAVALHYTGKREQARSVAARLLSLTEPEGSIRVYLDIGLPMKQVLSTLLDAPPDDDPRAEAAAISRSYVSRLLVAFKQEELREPKRALSASLHSPGEQETTPHLSPTEIQLGHTEPLSRQEQRVLRLLVAGQTYAEIARALIVSPHTVKTQVSSIYRKLGVSRRAEAIAVTRELHLL